MYIVYIQTDARSRVTAVNSNAFLADPTGWIEIDRGNGDRYHHAQGNYMDGPLMTDEGVPRYALVDGQVRVRGAEPGSYWRHGDKLYRVNAGQGHTIQADWAHNAYAVGDKVTHDGKKWTSTADANTWEPGAAGVYESIWKGVI